MKLHNLTPDEETRARYLFQMIEELVPLNSYILFEVSNVREYIIVIEIKSKKFSYHKETSLHDFEELVLKVKEEFNDHLKQWYQDRDL